MQYGVSLMRCESSSDGAGASRKESVILTDGSPSYLLSNNTVGCDAATLIVSCEGCVGVGVVPTALTHMAYRW
jgi:hypothetical protein